MKQQDEFINGRKGCSGCERSESFELMQLNTIQPHDSGIIMFPTFVYGKENDLQELLQMDNLLAEL